MRGQSWKTSCIVLPVVLALTCAPASPGAADASPAPAPASHGPAARQSMPADLLAAFLAASSADPLAYLEQKVLASGGPGDHFGGWVALSGDGNTAAVGAPGDDIGTNADQGSAYVFTRSGTTWILQQRLTASDGAADDWFGGSVALSSDGDTLLVGAGGDDVGGNANQGSAYVFVRSGVTWNEQAHLFASDGAAEDWFGDAVALSGETALVGAASDDVGANQDQGSAYVFVRSGVTWSEQAHLFASDGAAEDEFGWPVALSGETALVGACQDDVGANANQGSAYVFVRSGVTWSAQAHLIAADGAAEDWFGSAVALAGETALVGAYGDDVGAHAEQGSAYVFLRSGVTWSEEARLIAADGAAGDYLGYSVALSGDTALLGAPRDDVDTSEDQGSAYIFLRSGATWSEQSRLSALDGAADDWFGSRAALSGDGDTALVGAAYDQVAGNSDQGSACVFVGSGTTWGEQAQLTGLDGDAGDGFGIAVALAGDTALVGAYSDDVGAHADQGSVYVFVRGGTGWTQQARLTAADGAGGDMFGAAVALSSDGNTALVGAYGDDIGANADQGSAYVFLRSGGIWNEQAHLFAADGAAGDRFGRSVALSGETALVGAEGDDVGAQSDQGSAYIFLRSGGVWNERAHLFAADGGADDWFGSSVALSGDTALVGAAYDDVGVRADQGSAYVFVRSGTTWSEQAHLFAADGGAADLFGSSVALSGDTALVGAHADDVGLVINQGSAYVFTRAGTVWKQQAKMTASDGAAGDQFGYSVALWGDAGLVGALLDDVGANTDQGSAYLFTRSGAAWSESAHFAAADGVAQDGLGTSVALWGGTALAGAAYDDAGAGVGQGSAYFYTPVFAIYLPLVGRSTS